MIGPITTSCLRFFAVITTVLCVPSLASAATLQAKVVEVQSGNTLVVSNINRPIRIRLKAIVPPENGQPFSEAAREHLKVLVFNRTVTVEYTHLAEGFLEAKVFVNGIDIGSQMLRDIRILTRRVDGQRQFFMLCVMTRSGDGSLGNQFLNSFKINGQ